MKIMKTINKIPAGLMIVPLFMGILINTFCPRVLQIGSFTTATFSNAVESQDPVVSVDWKDSHWEFTDFFDALRWIRGLENVTLTLLEDVMVTQQIELTPARYNILDNLTVDLNNHTLSGNFDDEAVVYFNPATAYHIAFKNGTIENTAENGTAVQLWDGQITMENVNINGDFVIKPELFTEQYLNW